MRNLPRIAIAIVAPIVLATALGTNPAAADTGVPNPAPSIAVPTEAVELPAAALPLFTPTGLAAVRADSPDVPVALLADQLRAAATLPQVINNVRTWIVGMLAGLATVFLTIGGLRYLMAGGNPGEVEKAKIALKSAAVGYALAVLAPVLVSILQSLVGA